MAYNSDREPLLAASHKTGTSEHSSGASNQPRAYYQSIVGDLHSEQGVQSAGRHRRGISFCETMEHQPVTLSWENISVCVEEKKKKRDSRVKVELDAEVGRVEIDSIPDTKNGQKPILRDVSGVVQPGTLLAIMGASGAGKSTLMNVLTNRNLKDYILEGNVKVNGSSIGRGIKNISAYVQQDDLFISTLTVRETLTFRALLRMDNSIKKKERLDRVEQMIQEMGLSKCANTQIGRTGTKKGISGGESKRLSFACELLTNPPLLFCDEPTSGLDSFMAQNIVSTLQSMAKKNKTILCTIHQPSSEIFAMFDRLLLLAEGRVAFIGPSSEAVEFFKSLSHVCPTNFNPADFYVLTLAIVPEKEVECKKKVSAICDAFMGTPHANEIKDHIKELTTQAKEDPYLIEEAFSGESRYEAGLGRQFITVLWRTWISLIRNVFLFRVRMFQTIVVAVILGLVFLQLEIDQKGVMNVNGAIFLIITNASFSNLFAIVNSFPHELPIFLREYGTGLYRTDTYFLAKNLAEFPTFVLLPFLMITVDYWMIGLYSDWKNYLIASAIIIFVSNVAVSFGMIMSTLAGDVNIALAIAPPIMIPFMMFGGFFLNNDSVPDYFIWLKYLSWFKYSNELLVVNQWENVDHIGCNRNTTASGAGCAFSTGADVLDYMGFSAENTWLNIGLMFALMFGFRILSFIFLLVRARRSQN